MDQNAARSRDILACLGDASRFRIVLSLLEHERCVTELAAQVGLSQSCTTRHLQYLERKELVRGQRQGKRVVFRLRSDRARVRELLAWVTATAGDRGSERLSGAELHAERPTRRGRRRVRSPAGHPPSSDRPWVRDGGNESSPGSASLPQGADGNAGTATAPVEASGAASGPPVVTGEMEDWLL